jgi:uncharacterized protein (DUF1697 family)
MTSDGRDGEPPGAPPPRSPRAGAAGPDADPTTTVFLLRAINVGRRQVPMAALREVAQDAGLLEPRTYLASGNLVALAPPPVMEAAQRLEAALEERFGFVVEVVARSAEAFAAYPADLPFAARARQHPNRVMLVLSRDPVRPEGLADLRARAAADDLVEAVRDGLWIAYSDGVARSRLTPAALDAAFGAPATARNWRTVQALAALAATERR